MKSNLQMRLRDMADAFRRVLSAVGNGFGWWFEGTRQIGSQLQDGLFLLGRLALLILLFPWRLAQMFFRAIQGLSGTGRAVERSVSSMGKSVRGSVIDLQESIESQPEVLKGRWQRLGSWLGQWFRSRPAWQRHGLRVAFVLGLVALAAAYPAWRQFKNWRAEQFIAEAQNLMAAGRPMDAYFKGQAAYNLIPGDPAVLTELIEIARAVHHPQTLQWGRQLIDQGSASAQTVATLAEVAQGKRELALARAYVARLERLDPEHPDLPYLRLRLLLQRGDEGAAFRLAASYIESPEVDRRIAQIYFGLGLELEDASRREAVRSDLHRFASEDTARGLVAALLLLNPDLGDDSTDPAELVARILENPDAGRDERLRAYTAQAEYELEDWETVQARVRGEFDLNTNEGRVGYAGWLLRIERYGELADAFSLEVVAESRELYTLHTLALLLSGREQMALERLRSADAIVIPELERLILEARALRELGQNEAFVSTVERAIARADETQFSLVERLLRQLGEERFLIALYEKFASIPSTAVRSNANLLVYAYRQGDADRLDRIAARMRVESLDAMPVAQGLLAYVKGLQGEDADRNCEVLERLVSRYPSVIDFRVSLAVNYLRAGFKADAGAILADAGMDALSGLPGMYAVSLAILESVGELPAEVPSASTDAPEMLPQERAFIEGLANPA